MSKTFSRKSWIFAKVHENCFALNYPITNFDIWSFSRNFEITTELCRTSLLFLHNERFAKQQTKVIPCNKIQFLDRLLQQTLLFTRILIYIHATCLPSCCMVLFINNILHQGRGLGGGSVYK